MIPNEFKYNGNIKYQAGDIYKTKKLDIITQKIVIISNGQNFMVSFPNLFEKYVLPQVKSDSTVQNWKTNQMQFWQNQLNFAIWCTTTGCGVDFNNHLSSTDKLTNSLFKFHVYYQIRRILKEMSAPLPQNQIWNAFDNGYDRAAYEKICNEFNVDPNTDWRQKRSDNQGLGTMYLWSIPDIDFVPFKGLEYNSTDYTFDQRDHPFDIFPKFVNHIAQNPGFAKNKNGDDISDSWSKYIIENAKGFTRAGIERINESIRTYCWAILGSQSQTRTDILGTGTSFDAQKQFIANIEDAINSPVDLPSQIERYQNTLKYARSKVDFVFGSGLYMAPSNMELKIGTTQDYNNEIVIATDSQKLGTNNNVNTKPVPVYGSGEISGTPTRQLDFQTDQKQTDVKVEQTDQKKIEEHKDNKTALTIGFIAGFALIYKLF